MGEFVKLPFLQKWYYLIARKGDPVKKPRFAQSVILVRAEWRYIENGIRKYLHRFAVDYDLSLTGAGKKDLRLFISLGALYGELPAIQPQTHNIKRKILFIADNGINLLEHF